MFSAFAISMKAFLLGFMLADKAKPAGDASAQILRSLKVVLAIFLAPYVIALLILGGLAAVTIYYLWD